MDQVIMIRVLEICLVVKAMRLESYDAFEPHPTHRHLNAYKIIRFTVYDRPHSEGQLHFYGFITRNSRNFPYFSFITVLESLQAPTPALPAAAEPNGPASPQSPGHDQRRTSWHRTRQLPAEPPRRSAHQSRECGGYEQSTAGSAPQSSPRPQLPEP